MSQYFNKNMPYFDNVTGDPLAFGVIYFGQPNTDPKDQDFNSKSPFTDRELTTPADAVQTLTSAGKMTGRLYLNGAYSVTVTDSEGADISVNPYYVGESSDQIVNDSTAPGATLSDALDGLLNRIATLEASGLSNNDIYPVGTLYLTTINENPGSRLGIGIWSAHAQGQVIAGVGGHTDGNGDARTFAVNDAEGAYNHTLTIAESADHKHFMFSGGIQSAANTIISGENITAREFADDGNNDQYIMKVASAGSATAGVTSSVGGNAAHNNVQPTVAVYIWRRTS